GVATPVATTGRSWSQVRGSFMLSGTLYTGWADGHLCAAPFDGTAFGTWQPVVMNNAGANNQFIAEIPSITGMFFYNNRIYYTKTASSTLFYRPFSPEDNMVGPQSVSVQSTGGNVDFSKINGMFLSADPQGTGKTFLYYSTNDGVMHHVDWNGTATV